jgi:hypothetical protein
MTAKDPTSKGTDDSQIMPTRRASTPVRFPLRGLGHGFPRLMPRWRRRREIPVNRHTDLADLEGEPGPWANVDLTPPPPAEAPFIFSLEWWQRRMGLRITLITTSPSPEVTAVTAIWLVIVGAFLAGCALIAGHDLRAPAELSLAAAVVLFAAPLATYFLLRRRR